MKRQQLPISDSLQSDYNLRKRDEMPQQANDSHIHRGQFRAYGRQVVELLAHSFNEMFTLEGNPFQRPIRLSQQRSLLLLLDLLHPVLSRFGEVFTWTRQNQVLGTGAVIRKRPSDPDVWVLINFAIARPEALGIEAAVRMRTILRMALRHATLHGANEILAYVRSDNKSVLTLCFEEGFQEVDELCSCFATSEHIEKAKREVKSLDRMQMVRHSKPVSSIAIDLLLSYLRGATEERFAVFQENRVLGTIEMFIPKDACLSYRLSITPSINASTDDAFPLVSSGISLIPAPPVSSTQLN